MIIIDTSAIIQFLAAKSNYKQIESYFLADSVAVSALSVHELLIGANQPKKLIINEFLKSVHIFEYNEETAKKSIEIEEKLAKKGKLINKMDILIAATCLQHNLSLITCDNDFKNIEELNVILV